MPTYVYTVIADNGLVYAFHTKHHALRAMANWPNAKYSERYDYSEYQLYEKD